MALFDFTDTLAAFNTGTYTVTRYGAATWGSDGRSVLPSPSTFSISAAVFPVMGRELERMPEGFRTKELRAFATATLLRTATQGVGEADTIAMDGFTWQVQQVDPWNIMGGFYWVVASKVGN